MGILKAKCPICWDSIPCSCPEQKERESEHRSWEGWMSESLLRKQKELLEEQNRLLRKLVKKKKV